MSNTTDHSELIARHAEYAADIPVKEQDAAADPGSFEKQVRADVAHFKVAHLAVKAAAVGIDLPVSEKSIAIYSNAQNRFGN